MPPESERRPEHPAIAQVEGDDIPGAGADDELVPDHDAAGTFLGARLEQPALVNRRAPAQGRDPGRVVPFLRVHPPGGRAGTAQQTPSGNGCNGPEEAHGCHLSSWLANVICRLTCPLTCLPGRRGGRLSPP